MNRRCIILMISIGSAIRCSFRLNVCLQLWSYVNSLQII